MGGFVVWNLGKGNDFLPGVSTAELKRLYVNEKQAKAKQRLLCALHRKQGKSIDDIKGIMQMPRRTVHGCLKRFDENGISAKYNGKRTGRPPLLTKGQRRKLVKDLEAGPPYNKSGLWTTKEVRGLLKRKYRVYFVNQHVWRMLTSMGFSMQRPRKRHYKSATDSEIEAFKKSRGKRQGVTEIKALSWAQKTRPRSA